MVCADIVMANNKFKLKLDCCKDIFCRLDLCLTFCKGLAKVSFRKMNFSLDGFVSSCGIRLAGLVSVCRWFGFYEGYGNV